MSSPAEPTLSDAEALSAVWDNQADAQQAELAVAAFARSAEQRDRWRSYAAITQACQGEALPAPDSAQVHRIMALVQARPHLVPNAPAVPLGQMPITANDPVWRWKVAAGLLATVAVASIAWGLLGAAPSTGQLAENQMIRNPELEALLAEHRQHAGLSAVQVSSGFLRNATYEVPAKR
jgi:sigma-E factor negative regulatory protein RseA